MLTTEETKKIATLARIELTDAEVEKFSKNLSTVLDYVEELKQVNTEGILELSQVTGLENVLRKDEVEVSGHKKEIFDNAPTSKDGYFKVKSIL